MPYSFYQDIAYRQKQSSITKYNWKKGIYKPQVLLLIKRICKNCKKSFYIKPYDKKVFCSRSCSVHVNNSKRILSFETRKKISRSILALPKAMRPSPPTKPKVGIVCIGCSKTFQVYPYLAKRRKHCSIHCNISRLGKKTTSPKASKGKNGIRRDIDPFINFYSTWEANIARVFNLVGIRWEYAPTIFDLGEHTYRPDFYLPKFNMYIEVKNFMNDYSKKRDRLFRQRFPELPLTLILKRHYLEIKKNYKSLVDHWEY